MTDRAFTPTEELPTMQDGAGGLSDEQKKNEEEGDHFLQIQVGAADISAKHVEKEEKEQKDQDPTVKHYLLRQMEGVHDIYERLVHEDKLELDALTSMLNASIENNSDHALTAQLLQRIDRVQAGAAEQKEHDEIQVEAATPSTKQKEQKKKKMKEKKGKKKKEEDKGKRRQGQINSVNKTMQNVRSQYRGFLNDTDQAELEEISSILNAVNEDSWDDAFNADLLRKIDLVKKRLQKRVDDDNLRGQKMAEFETNLDQGVNERRAEAQSSISEAKGRLGEAKGRLKDAIELKELVSEFKISVRRLEDQRSLVPTEDIVTKLAMGEKVLKWLEYKLEQLQELLLLDHNELVTKIKAWNKELLDNTFWDHSPENTETTKTGRKPVDDFDSIKKERFIFNSLRDSLVNLIEHLRDRLCDHPQYGSIASKEGQLDQIYCCRLLEYQSTPSKQPPRWFILELRSGSAKTYIFIRSDNLYIAGFANQIGTIYELSNASYAPLIRNSLPFGCSCDYPSLMNFERVKKPPKNQDIERLKELVLNMASVSSDIEAMSKYDHTKKMSTKEREDQIKQVQIAIARTAICFPEVARLFYIFSCVTEEWISEFGSHLTETLIHLIRHWRDISWAIRNDYEGRKFTAKEQTELGMTYACEGFKALCLVLNTKGEGLVKDDPKGDGPKPKPPPPAGNDRESKNDNGKGRPSTPPGPENNKESKNEAGKGGSSTPSGSKNEGGASQSDGDHDTELSGQPLLEIFSVHTNSHLIRNISVYDDRGGKVIYKSSKYDIDTIIRKRNSWLSKHPGREPSDYMDELVITGPDRAISALPWYIIEVDVGDEKGVFDLSWNWADRTGVNKPMTQSIFTSGGEVHLTSAVFSNAVQVSIEIMVFLPRVYEPVASMFKLPVMGNLVLQIENFSIGIKMFKTDVYGSTCFDFKRKSELTAEEYEEDTVCMKVPLDRSVFALPVNSGLRVTGTLAGEGVGTVSIDRSMMLNHKGGFCKWKLLSSGSPSIASLAASHAAILINPTSPF